MRENIGLYRGKEKPNGEWIEGFLVDAQHIGNWVEAHPVDPETVGECSGVPDKHGKLIYEDDIVRIDDDVKEMFPQVEDGPVRFSRGGFFVGCYGDILRSFDVIADYRGVFRGEIIGNIHDNPELLEVSK